MRAEGWKGGGNQTNKQIDIDYCRVTLATEKLSPQSNSQGQMVLGPLASSNTFPLHPLTSSYLFLLLPSFGMVWLWGGGEL